MHLIGRIVLVVGVLLCLYGGFESYLASGGTAQPETIKLADLGKKGPIKNTHVTITDFTISEQYLSEQTDTGRWTRVWVPLLTPEGKWPERPVIAWVNKVQNDGELAAKIDHPTLTGVITNGVQSFGKSQQEDIAPAYPGIDLSNAIAFNVGRSFPSMMLSLPLLVVGIVLSVVGGGMTFGLIKWG